MAEKLRLYLDQMFGIDLAQYLRDEGYDVLRASQTGQSWADDQQILQKAISENRILITLDEHFGDWAVLPLSRHPGVIRLKVSPTTSENVQRLLIPFLRQHLPGQFQNRLVILSSTRVRWIHTD